MAKDWVGGSAAVFKTLGASNHTDADRQRDQSALQVCAAVCGEGSKHHSRRKEGGDVPETDFPRRQGPTRSLPFYPPIRVWVSSSRLKCAMNGDFDKYGSSAAAYAWFVWEKGYKGETTVKWFN